MMQPNDAMFDRFCAFFWGAFRDTFGGTPPAHEAAATKPVHPASTEPGTLLAVPRLAEQAAKLESRSARYGARYRTGFLVNFAFGFLAVTLAALPFALGEEIAHRYGWIFTLAEAFCILTILGMHLAGRAGGDVHEADLLEEPQHLWNQAWRRRWVENRVKAEQFRYAELLLGFPGGPLEIDADAGSLLDARLTSEFAQWYEGAREHVRHLAPPDAQTYRAFVVAVIDDQIAYHHKNAHRCEHIHHSLHRSATACFWATLAICFSHFFWHFGVLSVLAVSLPAAAAAFHGVLGAGEFATFSEQSEEMKKALEQAKPAFETADDMPLETLRTKVRQLYRLFIAEASGWHVALRSKDIQVG